MTGREIFSGVRPRALHGLRCYICGEQLRPAISADAAGELCAECRAEAATALRRPLGDFGDEILVNSWSTRHDVAEGLDSLVDAGLAFTYGSITEMAGRKTAAAGFVDLPKFVFGLGARVDTTAMTTEPASPIEPELPQHSAAS